MAGRAEAFIEVDGAEVRVSHPDKVVFPEPGLTKLDIVDYYLAVAGRPRRGRTTHGAEAVRRGIDAEPFFQKRVPTHPNYIGTAVLRYASGGSAEEAVLSDTAGLAWIASLGCLDLNPHAVRAGDLDHPDELRVDLDPMPGVAWSQIVDTPPSYATCSATAGSSAGRNQRLPGSTSSSASGRVGLLRGASRRRDARTRGRGPRARARDRALVEGGAGRERVRRLQSEREGPHRRIGVLGASAARRTRVGTARLGRGAAAPAGGVHRADRARPVRGDRRPARGH